MCSALGVWRGEPLADFAYEQFAQAEIERLQEERIAALEDRVDAELALGEHAAVVGELEALVRQHPLRERLEGQLMLALYRSGRQAEALERYRQTRRELVDELGIEPGPALQELERAILAHDPALKPPSSPSALERVVGRRARRLWPLLAAGALLLLVAVIAAALLSSGGGTRLASLPPNALGLIDPSTGQLRAVVPIAGTPARVQVSAAQVWVTSDDARTVSLVDARKPAIARAFGVGGFPSDFAVGEGGVWVVDRLRGRLVKISPDYGTVLAASAIGSSETLSVADDRNDTADPWAVAAGAGGVWITDGSRLLRRADPATGHIVRSYDVGAPIGGVAVGEGGVWAINGPSASVLRIDPRSGAVTARIQIVADARYGSPYPIAVAAGLGSVWVLNANAASVTRIDPAQESVTATIPLGIERVPRRLAVGAGAAWVADTDGTLARIDASTNTLTTTTVGASLYDVGVGAGGVWVTSGSTIAGGNFAAAAPASGQAQALPGSQCSPIYSAPGVRPRHLIVSELPLQGDQHDIGAQLSQAIAFALRQRGFRAGRFAVGYQACDYTTITPPTSGPLFQRCASNMRAYVADPSVIAVIGPYNSGCASQEIAIANRAPGGPLAMISPSTTLVGLTHRGPGTQPGEPGIYYPTGTRNFVRIVAADDAQGAADVLLAKQLRLHRVFVSDIGFDAYSTGIAASFALACRRLGIGIAGAGHWPSPGPQFHGASPQAIAAFARAVARTRPDGIFLAGFPSDPVAQPLIRALRARMPNVQFLAPDAFAAFPDVARAIGPALEGMTTVSQGLLPPSLLHGPGKRFVAQFGKQIGGSFYPWTAYGAQAAEMLLDAIARSDGTRASVTHALFATHVRNGIVGSFAITPTGDTTAASVAIFRIEHSQPVPLRVITPPASLTSAR